MTTYYSLILFDCFNTLYVQDASRVPGLLVDGMVKPTTVPIQQARIASRYPGVDAVALYRAHREARRWAESQRKEATQELNSRERFQYATNLLGLPADPSLVDDLMEAHYDTLIGTFRFPEEHRTLLAGLRSTYRLGLFSNFDHAPPLRLRLARDGLTDWLHPIIVSAELGWRKPGAEAFRMALELAEEAPERILFVGDSFDDDVVGACAAGIDCAWINTGAAGAEWIQPAGKEATQALPREQPARTARPTYELRSLADLAGLLADTRKPGRDPKQRVPETRVDS